MRARFKAMGLPCHICGKPIDYEAKVDSKHPWSFVIDEVKPVSRYKEWGYERPEDACLDKDNLAPAHYYCNLKKSNHVPTDKPRAEKQINLSDGEW